MVPPDRNRTAVMPTMIAISAIIVVAIAVIIAVAQIDTYAKAVVVSVMTVTIPVRVSLILATRHIMLTHIGYAQMVVADIVATAGDTRGTFCVR